MDKPNRQKTRNVFIGIVLLAIIIAAAAWVYISVQSTTLVIKSDKIAYFTSDEPEVEVKILNPKNATSGEVLINYPQENLVLEESDSPEGVLMREVGGKLQFDLSVEFFKNGDKNIATLKFSNLSTGKVTIEADKEKSFLNTAEGMLEFKKFDDADFTIGITEDFEEGQEPDVEENAGSYQEF